MATPSADGGSRIADGWFAKIITFLSGKKSYLVSLAAILYAIGISRKWWSHDVSIDLLFGGTYGITIRAAIKKLCLQLAADPDLNDAPAEVTRRTADPGVSAILIAASLSFMLGGCATAPGPNATPQQKAQAAIETATTGARYAVAPAVTAFLLLEKDPAKRAHDAAYVYAGATALNSAATGAVPTQTDLQALIATFVKPDPRYADLAQMLASEYGTLYPLFKIAGTSPVKFLTEVAIQAQNAAKPFLDQAPSA